MKRSSLIHAAMGLALVGLAACNDATNPVSQVISDVQLNSDVVTTSGDAIANYVGEFIINEAFAGLPASVAPSFDLFGSPPGVTVTRSRTCFDAQGQQQAQCDPITTASVLLTMTIDGSFTRVVQTPAGATDTLTASIHRARSLTISGLAGTETSRTHNGTGSSNDTTVFKNATLMRTMTEASLDSVQNVVFNLPHASNPWPVSGKIVRSVSGKVVVVGGEHSGERSFTRRIEVDFPADAQGNVVIKINDKTCNLNLVTHRVTNCST